MRQNDGRAGKGKVRRSTLFIIGALVMAVLIVWGAFLWREIRPKRTLPQCIIVGPTFTFQGEIVDGETEQPVTATVKVNDVVVHRGVAEFSVTFPQNPDQLVIIAVEASGYEQWALGIRPHGATARTMSGPIRLERIQPR